ncbi:MAG: type II secretion system protein N [Sphingobium sp.]
MRVPFKDRWQRHAARLAPVDWLAVAEKLVLAALAMQMARLVLAVATPVGVYGAWRGQQAQIPTAAARQVLFASFDPFFRSGAPQPSGAVVTSLALTVYGIRLNEGSGLGSAIIANADGEQNSFAVGDEIIPDVTLKAVAFDHVTIDRGGAEEQVFIDQSGSTPAPDGEGASIPVAGTATGVGAGVGAGGSGSGTAGSADPTAEALKRDIGFAPRMRDGRITGLVLTGKGPTFQTAGFRPGDIVTEVNGRPVGSPSDLQALQGQIVPGARISLMVERGAAVAPINLILQGQ